MTDLHARHLRLLRALTLLAVLASATAITLAVVVMTRDPPPPPPLPTELTLQRLTIVEPDGTPRLVIASRARFPGMFVRGKEIARPDRTDEAGILFVNDEGTENGGLVQSGKLDSKGVATAGLSLTFDRFRQDQVLQLLHAEESGQTSTAIMINDRPSYKAFSIDDMTAMMKAEEKMTDAERDADQKQHLEAGHVGQPRAYLGTDGATSQLVLLDAKGHPRVKLAVTETGEPELMLLDAKGQAVRTIK